MFHNPDIHNTEAPKKEEVNKVLGDNGDRIRLSSPIGQELFTCLFCTFLMGIIFNILRYFLLGLISLMVIYQLLSKTRIDGQKVLLYMIQHSLFSPFHKYILSKHYFIISNGVVVQKSLSQYQKENQPFLVAFIKYLANHPKYLDQFGNTAQKLIVAAKNENYTITRINALMDYYSLTTEELIDQYITTKQILDHLQQRIFIEADVTDREKLYRELNASDPLLLAFEKYHNIELKSGLDIMK
ncbi:hypothetical protein NEF87_004590 [Candidatus Lokiarchaeum ossiferum]|uniref:Uncharacterized protein n=1 Tax=Candidatus Lokiarchaeum ossiferum TaxID=2951803 RepID=A0ABY6HY11_9ARCH|nr:hypothetical protein NEF87_004590 [Candidatus Lokiarchaeum sp. B-35]